MRTALLKQLLETPSYTGREYMMIGFLVDYCTAHDYDFQVDCMGNVLITKGIPPKEDGFYPVVCAHTDTVHFDERRCQAVEEDGDLKGYDSTGERMGMGGDDKAGIFVCLELLASLPCLKVALFVSEENGCHGSRGADGLFFEDVGYAIEFDSPQNDIVSFSCDGQQLFDVDGDFIEIAEPLMEAHGAVRWQRHPYTDVAVLRRRFGFECLNLPCGYFAMHSDQDYVNLADVKKAISLGQKLVKALGCRRYALIPGFVSEHVNREVTELRR